MSGAVLISGGLAEGGIRTHVRLLCKVLRAEGAEVSVAASATNWAPRHLDDLREMGVVVEVTPWGFGRLALLGKLQAVATWPLVLRRRFDTVYCLGYGRMHGFLRRFLRSGGRAVYHEIADAPTPGHHVVPIASRMDGIVANSSPVARRWRSLAPEVPVRVIPFLTDSPASGSGGHRAVGADEVRIAFLGRLVRHKRADWLVRSWPEIARRVGPARLDVHGGDFPDQRMLEDLRSFVRLNGLEDRVTLHGGYDAERDLDRILGAADLVVLPSEFEGLPLSLVEAMARGVPVVATTAGGTADLAEGNPDVFVTAPDTDAFMAGLAEAVRRLRSGAVDHARLARWTRDRYGLEAVAGTWRKALLDGGQFWAEGDSAAQPAG